MTDTRTQPLDGALPPLPPRDPEDQQYEFAMLADFGWELNWPDNCR